MKLTKGMKKALSVLLSGALAITGVNVTADMVQAADDADKTLAWTGTIGPGEFMNVSPWSSIADSEINADDSATDKITIVPSSKHEDFGWSDTSASENIINVDQTAYEQFENPYITIVAEAATEADSEWALYETTGDWPKLVEAEDISDTEITVSLPTYKNIYMKSFNRTVTGIYVHEEGVDPVPAGSIATTQPTDAPNDAGTTTPDATKTLTWTGIIGPGEFMNVSPWNSIADSEINADDSATDKITIVPSSKHEDFGWSDTSAAENIINVDQTAYEQFENPYITVVAEAATEADSEWALYETTGDWPKLVEAENISDTKITVSLPTYKNIYMKSFNRTVTGIYVHEEGVEPVPADSIATTQPTDAPNSAGTTTPDATKTLAWTGSIGPGEFMNASPWSSIADSEINADDSATDKITIVPSSKHEDFGWSDTSAAENIINIDQTAYEQFKNPYITVVAEAATKADSEWALYETTGDWPMIVEAESISNTKINAPLPAYKNIYMKSYNRTVTGIYVHEEGVDPVPADSTATTRPTDAGGTPSTTQPTDAGGTQSTTQPTDAGGTQSTTQPTDAGGTQSTTRPTDGASTPSTTQPTDDASTQSTTQPTDAGGTQSTTQPTDDVGTSSTPLPTDDASTPSTTQPTDDISFTSTAQPTEPATTEPAITKPTTTATTSAVTEPAIAITKHITPNKTSIILVAGKSTTIAFKAPAADPATQAAVVTATVNKSAVLSGAVVTGSKVKITAASKATKGATATVILKSEGADGKTVSAKIKVTIQNKAKKITPKKKSISVRKDKTTKLVVKVTAQNTKNATTDTVAVTSKLVKLTKSSVAKGKVTLTLKGSKKGTKNATIKIGTQKVKVKVTVKLI